MMPATCWGCKITNCWHIQLHISTQQELWRPFKPLTHYQTLGEAKAVWQIYTTSSSSALLIIRWRWLHHHLTDSQVMNIRHINGSSTSSIPPPKGHLELKSSTFRYFIYWQPQIWSICGEQEFEEFKCWLAATSLLLTSGQSHAHVLSVCFIKYVLQNMTACISAHCHHTRNTSHLPRWLQGTSAASW